MLLTFKQMKYLQVDKKDTFKFVDNGNSTAEERKELLELDEDYFEIYGHHIISNFEELKNKHVK